LKAHFDFVVSRDGEPVAFAVEFDGPGHHPDPDVIARDAMKNSICDKLGMPLLRIDADFLQPIGQYTVLGWLAEIWFVTRELKAMQAAGELNLAYDESIHAEFVAYTIDPDTGARSEPFPYDPFLPHAWYVGTSRKASVAQGSILKVVAFDPTGYCVGLTILPLASGGNIIGTARCRWFHFANASAVTLAADLSMVQAVEKLKMFERGEIGASSDEEVQEFKNTFEMERLSLATSKIYTRSMRPFGGEVIVPANGRQRPQNRVTAGY
jgi:hypothetical protein